MNITKYAHACLVLEEQGQKLVIDPGGFTPDFGDLSSIVGIVVTHAHGDHFNPAHLARIAEANPDVVIFATGEVATSLSAPTVTAVEAGQSIDAGVFHLEFFGGQHAQIHTSLPQIQNVGVMVNDSLYYPGDSFAVPAGKQVTALALPVSAPWLKLSEAMDFLLTVKPRLCFPTHNAVLSDTGQSIVDNLMGPVASQAQTVYHSLKPGQTLSV